MKQSILWKTCGVIRIFFFALLVLSGVSAVKAQTYSDTLSVTVYYSCGSGSISGDSCNRKSLRSFIEKLDSVDRKFIISPISLSVTSSTSPEGGLEANRQLSSLRAYSLLDYLSGRSETFRSVSSLVKCNVEELTTNHRLGKVLVSDYPGLRYARLDLHLAGEPRDKLIVKADTVKDVVDQPDVDREEETDSVVVLPPVVDFTVIKRPLLFVKTNLLYDLGTLVNLSVEVPITKKLTVEATLVNPWWRKKSKCMTIHLRHVAITPRYYFKETVEPYSSFFAGLTFGSGIYDFQFWSRKGEQGTFWHISPTFGYSHHIAKRWKMEYSASLGYLQVKRNKYTQVKDTKYGEIKVRDYPWVTRVLRTPFPTSLNVSLVYMFNKTKRIRHDER